MCFLFTAGITADAMVLSRELVFGDGVYRGTFLPKIEETAVLSHSYAVVLYLPGFSVTVMANLIKLD